MQAHGPVIKLMASKKLVGLVGWDEVLPALLTAQAQGIDDVDWAKALDLQMAGFFKTFRDTRRLFCSGTLDSRLISTIETRIGGASLCRVFNYMIPKPHIYYCVFATNKELLWRVTTYC